nr:putative salivary secreted peptide 1 [Ephestia kuehniella]
MRALAFLSLLCVIAAVSSQSHDLVLGKPGFGDVIIYRTNEYKYGFPLFVRTSIIEYPEPGHYNFAYITSIYVKDNDHDGTGGYPTISSGGVGQRFAKIKLKSQRGGGLNFTITIHGRY